MPGELQFVPQLNPFLIFPSKSAGKIIQLLEKSVDEPIERQESESVLDKTAEMYHVAQKLRQEILSTTSHNNCLGITKENAANCITESLYVFLRFFCTGKDLTELEQDDDSVRRCVLSIAQDVIFGVSKAIIFIFLIYEICRP